MYRPSPEWTQFRRFPVTSAIWALSVIVTLAWWGRYDVTPLLETEAVAKGQLWRLLTSTLLHVNILHLMFNLFWWWRFGTAVEAALGKVRLLMMFVILAIGSGAAEFAWGNGGVGLSGVGYRLAAFLYVARNDPRFSGFVNQKTILIFAAWFVFCVMMTLNGTMPVANMAHAYGAILGAMMGYCLVGNRRRAFAALAACTTLFAIVAATVAYPYFLFGAPAGVRESLLGYNALMHNHDQSAAAWLERATQRDPRSSWNWYNYGIALHGLGRLDEARDAYARAKELAPDDQQIAEAYAALSEASDPKK